MPKKSSFGPGFILAAAFVGPGTVITCSAAGAGFGTALLWALAFSGIATWVLQEMSMRLSLATGRDLTKTISQIFKDARYGTILAALVAIGITIGCMAYQAGNLIGGASGLVLLLGGGTAPWIVVQALLAAILLWTGTYKILERALLALVVTMSLAFIAAAAMHPPAFLDILSGIFAPSLPLGSIVTVIALVGTTVVPYNLFLHSRIAREKWGQGNASGIAPASVIRIGRADLAAGVLTGIVISMAIMIAASSGVGMKINGIASLAEPLRRTLGDLGAGIFGLGLWAAGLTSAITAPLAAAYTVSGAFGSAGDRRSIAYRATWIVVLATGVGFAVTSTNPLLLIIAAQALNGIILPFAALVLLIALNMKHLMGERRNSLLMNLFAVAILIIVAFLAARSIMAAFKI